jgi:hypothetical protein
MSSTSLTAGSSSEFKYVKQHGEENYRFEDEVNDAARGGKDGEGRAKRPCGHRRRASSSVRQNPCES